MAIQQEVGDKGEQFAADYLLKLGYKILEKNFRAQKSEIDIICKEENTLVFVEVKARSSIKFGHPEAFVNEAKSAKIMEGAESYMVENNWAGAIRFDIISILFQKDQVELKHFKDALY